MKRFWKFVILIAVAICMTCSVYGEEQEEDEFFVSVWDVYEYIGNQIYEKADILYSGTIEANDIVNVIYYDEVSPEEAGEYETEVNETYARNFYLYNDGQGIVGKPIGEPIELKAEPPYVSLYTIIEYARREMPFDDHTAAVLSNGEYTDLDSYVLFLQEELKKKKKIRLEKEEAIYDICEKSFASCTPEVSDIILDIRVFNDDESYPTCSLVVQADKNAEVTLSDFSDAVEPLFDEIDTLQYVGIELTDPVNDVANSLLGFFAKSVIDGRIMNSDCPEEEILELLYSLRIDNFEEETSCGKDDAMTLLLRRMNFFPDIEENRYSSFSAFNRAQITINLTHDLTEEQLSQLPLVANVYLALIPDLTSVEFRFPYENDTKHEIVCFLSWGRSSAKKLLSVERMDSCLESLESFQKLLTDSQEYVYEDYEDRATNAYFTDREYVKDHLTPSKKVETETEEKAETEEKTETDPVSKLENIIKSCREYEVNGASIFHDDEDTIAAALGTVVSSIENSMGSFHGSYIMTEDMSITMTDEVRAVNEMNDFTCFVPDELHFYSGQSEEEVFDLLGISRDAFSDFYYSYDIGYMYGDISNMSQFCDYITLTQDDELLGRMSFVIITERNDDGEWIVDCMQMDWTAA